MPGKLNFDQRLFINNSNHIKEWMAGRDYDFPSLMIAADVREWHVEENLILSFKTPQLDTFGSVGKKSSACDLCESDQYTSSLRSKVI